ncbi:hypothetical protein [Pseudochryseolinea flava]|uniref:Uncharacterized protein n=1 Tax=Pseudochryseolinea flava TaxID=2059302 RepID=A0A364Y0M7_9BACT|nr:hypothetical protein [Pseudochryseolinea flava]RAW00344.1 hypothetical protein DQQ10_14925 [Pseudochryseolinea flava]
MKRPIGYAFLLLIAVSCGVVEDLKQSPELEPLEHGFKSSAAIAYCASIANAAFKGYELPSYISFDADTREGYAGAGVIYVSANASHPMPFNNAVGDIAIAALWNGNQGGVMSIIFGDIDILSAQYKLYGIHTVPFFYDEENDRIITLFAEQDIVIGEGSDTLLSINLSKGKFDLELERLEEEQSDDVFVAVTQNVWHISVDQRDSPINFYDDDVTVNGGGQIATVNSKSGGVLYHAMIKTKFNYNECQSNPISGSAFVQNFKAGSVLDLGTILLDFHSACNGKAEITLATGKYLRANGDDVMLNWQ